MLVLLPPSETKAAGGEGPPLDLDTLSFPELTPTRRRLVDALTDLADDVPSSLQALGLSERQADEVQRNAELLDSPTTPALQRYTGVLYDALDVSSLTEEDRTRADDRLAVASALFGIVRGTDAIPAYRLSGATTLPGLGTLRGLWRPVLEPVLESVEAPVVDLRSGAYAALAKVPGAIGVRVLSEDETGARKVVSHHNKAHKGKLARALAQAVDEPRDVEDVVSVAKEADIRIEREGDRDLCIVVG